MDVGGGTHIYGPDTLQVKHGAHVVTNSSGNKDQV